MALYQFVSQVEMQKKGQDDDGGMVRGQITECHVQSKEKGRGLQLKGSTCLAHWQKLSVVLTPVVTVFGKLKGR